MDISVITSARDSRYSGHITLVMEAVGMSASVTGGMIVVTRMPKWFR